MAKERENKLWSVTRIQHPMYPQFQKVRVGEYVRGGTLHVFRKIDGKQRSWSIR